MVVFLLFKGLVFGAIIMKVSDPNVNYIYISFFFFSSPFYYL